MLYVRTYIASTVAAIIVAGPLLYFHLVGRQEPLIIGYCGVAGPRDVWRYGWPAIYGTRVIAEEWFEPRNVGPLDHFSGQAIFWNLGVSALMIWGSIRVVNRGALAARKRQVSLRTLLLLPAVAAGVYTFVRYDRSPNLLFFVVPRTPARFDPARNPILFRPQAITDFPLYLSVPILLGVAAGVYAGLLVLGTFVAFLSRMAHRGSTFSPAQSALCRLLAIATLLSLIGGTAYAARAAYRFRTICHAAVSGRLATEWVSTYVFMHNGEWPRSWDAIRECVREYGRFSSDYNDEGLIEMVQAYVAIDCQADPRAVAKQTAAEFDAIRPIDGYGVDHREYWRVQFLIDAFYELTEYGSNAPQPKGGSPEPEGVPCTEVGAGL